MIIMIIMVIIMMNCVALYILCRYVYLCEDFGGVARLAGHFFNPALPVRTLWSP